MASRAYVGQFNFKGGDQQNVLASCPGGAQPVHLARMLKSGANLLLLTNQPTISMWTRCAR